MVKRLTHGVWVMLLLGTCSLFPAASAAGANYALSFVNDRVDIPYIGEGRSFAEISLEAYVYWRGHAGSEGTSGIMEGRGSTLHWQINANSNVRIRFEGVDQNANANVQQNEWMHLAVTYNRATRELRMYKNGNVFHTFSGDSNTDTYWTSGYAQFGTSHRAGDRRWNGMIDELCIWNKVRTQAQIQANMSKGLLGTENGLVAYYKLNEGEGTIAHDSSPNQYDGTIVGATWVNLDQASAPTPADGALGVNTPLLQWKPSAAAVLHNVYFGTTPDLTEANLVAAQQPFAMYFHTAGLQPGVTYYWRVDEVEADLTTIHMGAVWSFTAEPLTAYLPQPADGAEGVFPAPTLSWLPGKSAVKHQLYFSMSFADVEGGAAAADKGTLTDKKFAPGVLRSSTTYYWRVDETQPNNTVTKGPVWSFTTADGVKNKVVRQWWSGIAGTAISALTTNADYPNKPTGTELLDTFEGPVNWADNYGTRMYGWLTPPQSGAYTFWISGDDNQELHLSTDANPANTVIIARVPGYTASREWTKYPEQKSAAITLQAGQKYFIQALGKEGTGGDSIAVSWQGPGIAAQEIIAGQYLDTFALPPLQAFSPSPANKAVDAPQGGALSWSAGAQATKHDVYFGDDAAAVAAANATSPLYKGQQAGTTFNAGALEWGKTYYWRIDEVGGAEVWKGSVWSFTTASFLPIEGFESYTDDEGNRIYESWVDGWTNGTGSQVGYNVAPFAEQTIVHGGKQSMPLEYNNVTSPFYSEAEYVFAAQQNWTTNGVDTLSLWVRGNPVRFVDKGNGAFTVGASGHDIWDNADDFRFVYKRLNGDGSVTVKVDSLVNTNAWAKAGVMIRESLDASSPMAYMIQSFSSGVSFGWRQILGATCGSSTQAGITAPRWVKLTRKGNAFTAQYSDNGTTWTDIKNADGTVTSTTIAMAANVYVGLCLTSHNTAATTTAEFSGAATTGSVSGQWQQVWIGDDPDRTNGADTLYVAIEDSTGKVAVSSDPTLVNAAAWTEWKVPLSSLTGVNLARVKKMYIGVGDRKAPKAGGSGRVFIDDIRVTRP